MGPFMQKAGRAEATVWQRLNQERSNSTRSQIEKGAFYASLKILEKLGKALDAEPYELITPATRKRRQ